MYTSDRTMIKLLYTHIEKLRQVDFLCNFKHFILEFFSMIIDGKMLVYNTVEKKITHPHV